MLEEINEQPKKIKRGLNESRYDRSMLMENGGKKLKRNFLDRRVNQSVIHKNIIDCEQFADKAIELILYNKINAKNAFDVNVEYLERLPYLLNKNEESSWQKASASLDASAKIYGYRVDSVHSETFKFLGGLSRADTKDENNQDAEVEKKERKERIGKHDGFLTLERDPRKLDLAKYDLEFDVDPLFKSMTARFSEAGARGLLLNNLPLDNCLDVLLECKQPDRELKQKVNSDMSELSTEIKSVIENTLSEFSLQDLKQIQICPDLNYFKKTRALETSLEKTFYQNLLNEFDESARENILHDKSIDYESLNNSINIADNVDQDNLSSYSHPLSQDSPSSPNFNDNINMINISNDLVNNIGPSYMDGFSYLKSDEIKEYIHRFGDGNKEILKNLQQFQSFANSLNQFDKWNSILKPSNDVKNKKEQQKKTKKEDKLFEFNSENEVPKKEIFDKEKKIKDNPNAYKKDKFRKRKVKQFYHYDLNVLFNLFSIRDQIIQDYPNEGNSFIENRQNDSIKQQNNFIDDENDFGAEPSNFEESKANPMYNQTFAKIDNEYEKKFGRLYKTFDVRFIKSKIWESFSNLNKIKKIDTKPQIEFKDIIGSVSNNLSKEIINNISTPTCFVCLLHLSNEKNLSLEEIDENNFIVKVEVPK